MGIKKIKSVKLIFENCMDVTLLPKDIHYMLLDKIEKQVAVNGYQYINGESIKRKIARHVEIKINPGQKSHSYYGEISTTKLFEMLEKNQNIIAIHMEKQNGKIKEYDVNWDDRRRYPSRNNNQQCRYDGNRLIVTI